MDFGYFVSISCSKDEFVDENADTSFKTEQMKYVKDIPFNIDSGSIFMAIHKLNSHIYIKDNKYNLDITSGDDIGVSKEIFNTYKQALESMHPDSYKTSMLKANKYSDREKELNNTLYNMYIDCTKYNSRNKSGSYIMDGPCKIFIIDLLRFFTWQLHISDKALNAGLSAVTIGAVWLPEPIVSKIIATLGGAAMIAHNLLTHGHGVDIVFFGSAILYEEWRRTPYSEGENVATVLVHPGPEPEL